MNIFVTDGLLRKSLAAVRSLGEAGFSVTVGEKTKANPSAFSKYCRCSLRYPDPEIDAQGFIQWVDKKSQQSDWDLFIPMDDHTMDIAIANRQSWEQKWLMVLPPTESYKIARDKYQSLQLAFESGMDGPKTILPKSLAEVKQEAAKFQYPVLIKPRESSGSRGIKVINGRDELIEHFQQRENIHDWMIQEYIPQGVRIDVCLIVNKQQEVRAAFVQKEVRHFPIPMGPSTVQESILHEELVSQCKRYLTFLPWYGVIEFEFMVDPRDGKPKFMEVNPRFWNSLECARISGVDFPLMLVQLAKDGDCPEQFQYQAGNVCRNLLPGDLLHFLSNPNRWRLEPSIWSRKVHDDILSKADPLPTIGFILACLRFLFDRSAWRKLIKRENG